MYVRLINIVPQLLTVCSIFHSFFLFGLEYV